MEIFFVRIADILLEPKKNAIHLKKSAKNNKFREVVMLNEKEDV